LMTEISDEQLRAGARDAEHLAILRSLQLRSVIIVPLVARGRTLGAITLVAAESGRRYGPDDLKIAEELGIRAALAADNAELYREAQQQAAVHVELNTALRDTMSQLREALQTRDEFLASASHDLKNPIASIKASAQLLERRLGRAGELDLEQVQMGLERIDAIATRAASQVDDLLDVARLHMGKPLDLEPRPTDLTTLTREMIAEHQQRTERHQIEFLGQSAQVVGTWDTRRLGRVLGNLLDNAIKYSPEGGAIRVQVRQEGGPEGWAVVTVEDQGIGIPPDEQQRIFGRFQRGTNVIGQIAGSGIGLASSRQIVENHGGTLTVASSPRHGSTFTIRLPIGAGTNTPK
jgi:signal transduction histidine kinase